MTRRIYKATLAILIILALVSAPAALALGNTVYTSSLWLADNLEYRNTISWHSTLGRAESFAIRMTGQGDAYPIVMNGDTVYGTTKISAMVSYAESFGKNVLAAVNSDFFFTQSGGVPLGIVIEDGVYRSSPGGVGAVVFGADGSVDIVAAPSVMMTMSNQGGSPDADNEGKTTVRFSSLNKPRADLGGMVLYNEDFSTVSTRTSSPGWFVRFKILEGEMSVSGEMLLEVTEILTSDGAVPIGAGNMVLTAAEQSSHSGEVDKFAVGDVVTLATSCSDPRLINAAYATGGGDVLISNGEIADTSSWTPALLPRAPRTAFGLLEDGTVVSYVVDGRNANISVGLTLEELAEEMLKDGCVYALNLDGGGSSALSVRIPGEKNASVVNMPSDGAERGCATYILFVTDAAPGGPARNLGLKNNGAVVLAESSVDLVFSATNRGYKPAPVPGDVQAAPFVPGATVEGSRYTAGSIAGTDMLDLFSPETGASGVGEIYVITRPTSITASRSGSAAALTSVRLIPGEMLEMDVTATYYRREVAAQAHSYAFDVSGDVGEMVAPGIFRATGAVGSSGQITISAGGRSIGIKVEISDFTDMINHWAREYAGFLAREGITLGVTPSLYGPDKQMLRGDYILMLYRAAGKPETAASGSFSDVPAGAYYEQALIWAKEAGVVYGLDDGSFAPRSPITRQDAFTFTYRALGYLNIDYSDGDASDLEGFPDRDLVDDYAVIPTATLIKLGVVEGSNGKLIPQNTLTRAQMAKVLAVTLQLPQNDA